MSMARPEYEAGDFSEERSTEEDFTDEEVTPAPGDAEETARHAADREPTPEEAEAADRAARHVNPEVAEHEREMMDIGAHVEGEGKVS